MRDAGGRFIACMCCLNALAQLQAVGTLGKSEAAALRIGQAAIAMPVEIVSGSDSLGWRRVEIRSNRMVLVSAKLDAQAFECHQ